MKSKNIIEEEIDKILRESHQCYSVEQKMSVDGRIRSLVWVITGIDLGWKCMTNMPNVFDTLGWKWHDVGDKILQWEKP